MRKFLFLFLICFSIQSCKIQTTQQKVNVAYLNALYKNHQYFELQDEYEKNTEKLSEKDRLILKAKISSVFNQREISNEAIKQVLEKFKNVLTERELIDLLEIKMMNSVYLYDYAEALKTSKMLLEIPSLSEEKRKDFSNVAIIYNELKDVPKQEILLRNSEIPINKDLAGLSRIPVTINKLEENVIFDTGANFSVITDSLAIRAGIAIGKDSFEVRSVTGNMVASHIGVADWLKAGNTLFKNVVFLVFPKESMTFPEANYSIDAILGFPVISAMEEIQLVIGKELIIGKSGNDSEIRNMALDFLTPIVEVMENGKSLPFTFDTGANSTALYADYFMLHQNEIEKTAEKDSVRIGGAGGIKEMHVYHIPFSGKIGNSSFELKNISVYEENPRDTDGIYGNLGQDVLTQFDTLLLDFKKMQFLLKSEIFK